MQQLKRERGVALIIVSVAAAALFVMAAIALDLSNVRNTRQDSKSTADLSVAAGLGGLVAVNGVPVDDGRPRPWSGVCAALDYLEANEPDLSLNLTYKDGNGDPLAVDPCGSTAHLHAPCTPNVATSFAWIHGTDGPFQVDIRSGYHTPDPAFAEDTATYGGDDGATAQGDCDQLAVIVDDEDPSFFGGVVGRDEYATRIRSVGRLDIAEGGPVAVAMVLLEQHDCEALNFQGGAGGTGQVIVRGTGTFPGLIHSDSDGTGSGCGAEQVIDGKNNGGPLVRALSAPSNANTHGVISTYHGFLGGTNGAGWTTTRADPATEVWMCDPDDPTGALTSGPTCATGPTGRDRATRKPADDRYLSDVTALRASARTVFAQMATPPASWTRYSSLGLDDCALEGGGPGAHPVTITPAMVSGPLFIDCPEILIKNGWTLTIADGIDEVYFQGGIGFAGTGALDIRDPERVLVNGTIAEGPAIRLAAGSTLAVNQDGYASCAARQSPATGEPARTTELVLRTSSLEVQGGGNLRLCGTFVHLMGATTTNAPVDTSAASYPAPYSNNQNGTFNVAGGGVVDWTAPNTNPSGPPTAASYDFEDLAVWTEAQPDSRLAGGGSMHLSGIFFLPNVGPDDGIGGLNIAGDSGSVIEFDAQLWARKLSHEGGAKFVMRSNPDDSIKLPFFRGAALVR